MEDRGYCGSLEVNACGEGERYGAIPRDATKIWMERVKNVIPLVLDHDRRDLEKWGSVLAGP